MSHQDSMSYIACMQRKQLIKTLHLLMIYLVNYSYRDIRNIPVH